MQSDYQKALELLDTGDLTAALASFNLAIAQNPDFSDAYYQRGRVRAKLNDFPGAIADYTQCIKLQPTAEAFLNRALIQLTIGSVPNAIADALEAVALNPQLALAHRLLGKAYTQLRNWHAAIASYKQATQCYIDQKDKENAAFCLAQIEELKTCLPSTTKTQSTPNYTPENLFVAPDFLQQIDAKIQQGKYAQALEDVNWLLQFDPNNAAALCHRATIQAKVGYASAAIQDLARAIQLEPENQQIRWQRTNVRLLLGDAAGAIADLNHLMAQDPNNPKLLLQRGKSYCQMEDWDKAFKDYSNAIGICPDDAELYSARAEAQQKAGDLKGAIADYQQAATMWLNSGNWSDYQQATQQVEAIKNTLKKQDKNQAIIVPIKYRVGGTPVVEVKINDRYTFDMILDTGAGITVIPRKMAYALQIQPIGNIWCRMADGNFAELQTGWLQSLAIQTAVVNNIQVAIADREVEALLGQDFLSHFDVKILVNHIELHRR